MKCKLKQRGIGRGVMMSVTSKYEAVLTFEKKKNNKWKKIKPLDKMGILEKGKIYEYNDYNKIGCVTLFHDLNESEEKSKAKKVKVKWKRNLLTSTHEVGVDVFNANYYFTNNS